MRANFILCAGIIYSFNWRVYLESKMWIISHNTVYFAYASSSHPSLKAPTLIWIIPKIINRGAGLNKAYW